MNKLNLAISTAKKWHGSQKYGNKEYIFHLFMVKNYIKNHYKKLKKPVNENLLILAMLHDIVEDTKIPKSELHKFGLNNYHDILRLTKSKPIEHYFERIRQSENAAIVKISDRICNIEYSIKTNNIRLLKKYISQKKQFSKLYTNANKEMQKELEKLYLKARLKTFIFFLSNFFRF